ncbi:uncharacterized protein LAESUDRAFT_530964 [Laetiporus sulphureus 93-53]|uniref:Uncharacterized protein n=1 Tax=Laetiporus sulphureus 93-53 TaxID=1314785 RepID=A0A165BAX2_9APHY|nr:uncharacterized protein LAESUDRAFT_530964 [Laetiporus sulphureus 93-53]KZT00642.1 hypothetical protein LAESUDRAFT_530964 [Laetiporus sulphureus 93-53]
MSVSPPIRRYSSTSSSSREDLINQYEAEEERIINVLSRKLERLREEKIALENTLEAESENHVNRLSREISALRLAQQQQAQANGNGSGGGSPVDTRLGMQAFLAHKNPAEPAPEAMLDAMRRENEQLRTRLVDTEREFIHISRLNEIYREELIEHRRRLGLPVDNLIGLSSADPYSQPTHRRSSSASSPTASIATSLNALQTQPPRPIPPVPIPRPPSQVHRPANNLSETTTPLSHSPSSSSSSPFPFSPSSVSPLPNSYASATTAITTPPSSASLTSNPPPPYPGAATTLSYPSVPPPSLSSSFGSPSTSFHMPAPPPISFAREDGPPSPVSPLGSRAHSFHHRRSFDRHVAETGNLRSVSRGHSRRASVERGARIAETGTLLPRGRLGRDESLQEAAEDGEGAAAQDEENAQVQESGGGSAAESSQGSQAATA